MRVLVIGGSGFIGRYLVRRLGGASGHEVFGTFLTRPPGADGNSWHRLDLGDESGLAELFRIARPEVVVHLAAVADVGACERDPRRAELVNVTATSDIARRCEQHGARLIFVSTEYVFDGLTGFYGEEDPPAPTTHYGRTKHEAEREVARIVLDWSIVRTSIVYGWPLKEHRNFGPWLVERLRGGQSYHGPTGVLRTPVYVDHLAEGIAKLVDEDHQGIHHIAGCDWVSMYDFADAVAKGFGLDRRLVVPDDGPGGSAGGERLGLDGARTMSRLGLQHRGIREGVAAMKETEPE